ncbi:hypothetical protein SAMN04487980_103919 [Streptomyces sp. cf124]|nr:hypothetical protein SAMN04487980_103919 [Streptomyces sp. cf124]
MGQRGAGLVGGADLQFGCAGSRGAGIPLLRTRGNLVAYSRRIPKP